MTEARIEPQAGERSWGAMHQALQGSAEVVLCTVLIFTHEGSRMLRAYSSHPREYPVGGSKDVATEVSPAWIATTRDSSGIFVVQTNKEIAEVFGDSDLIESLGCGSIVNVPLNRPDGSNWATVNILGPERAFSPKDIDTAVRLIEVLAPSEAGCVIDEGGRR